MPPFLFKKRVIFFAVILTALGSVGLMALLRLALEVRSRPPDLSATAAALEHQATQSALNSQATEIALHILATTTALEAAAAAIEATQTAVVAPAATGTPLPAPARPDQISPAILNMAATATFLEAVDYFGEFEGGSGYLELPGRLN
jgi:hypothetical protein